MATIDKHDYDDSDGTPNENDPFVRRLLAYIVLILFVSLGLSLGTLAMFSLVVLILGGPQLLRDVWEQSNTNLFLFFLFCIATAGSGGALLGGHYSRALVRKTHLISNESIRRIWGED